MLLRSGPQIKSEQTSIYHLNINILDIDFYIIMLVLTCGVTSCVNNTG